jgi:hypothetical protein
MGFNQEMMFMKVWLYTHDPILTLCYLPEEAKELFGENALDEDGAEVPETLAIEINAVYKRLIELSRQLEEIRNKQ